MEIINKYMCIFLLSCLSAFGGNEMTHRQKNILQDVIDNEKLITKDLHSEFWSEVSVQLRPKIGEFLMRFVELNVLNAYDFEEEGWRSIKISIQTRTPCITLKYLKLKEKFISESEKNCGFEAGSPEYIKFIAKVKSRIDDSYVRTLSWIEASASGAPVSMPTGQKVVLTSQMIDQAIASGQGMKIRLLKLANPNW